MPIRHRVDARLTTLPLSERLATIVELATRAAARTLPPTGAVAPPPMTADLLRRYGMEILPGPDPLRPAGR